MKRKIAHHADWFIVGLSAGLIIGLLMLWVVMSDEVTTSHTIAPNDLDVLKIDLVKN